MAKIDDVKVKLREVDISGCKCYFHCFTDDGRIIVEDPCGVIHILNIKDKIIKFIENQEQWHQ